MTGTSLTSTGEARWLMLRWWAHPPDSAVSAAATSASRQQFLQQ